MNGHHEFLIEARRDELRRDAAPAAMQAAARDGARVAGQPSPVALGATITVRRALPYDEVALARLAALDSRTTPPDPVLLAEVDGEPRAALSLSDGVTIADPFHPSAAIVRLLVLWAASEQADLSVRPRRRLRSMLNQRLRRFRHRVREDGGR